VLPIKKGEGGRGNPFLFLQEEQPESVEYVGGVKLIRTGRHWDDKKVWKILSTS